MKTLQQLSPRRVLTDAERRQIQREVNEASQQFYEERSHKPKPAVVAPPQPMIHAIPTPAPPRISYKPVPPSIPGKRRTPAQIVRDALEARERQGWKRWRQ